VSTEFQPTRGELALIDSFFVRCGSYDLDPIETAKLIRAHVESETTCIRNHLLDLYDGRNVVLPSSEKHAGAMMLVAENYLKSLK
jgi:hypothetical protein